MRGIANAGVVDWVSFPAPDQDGKTVMWNVHLTFLMSNWQCIYGQGCPGHFGITQRYVTPDLGCCTHGFWYYNNEQEALDKNVAMLTDADWDIELRKEYERRGSWDIHVDEDQRKSRTVDGACIFANRNGGSTGKPGCAFIQLAARLGEEVDDSTDEGHNTHTAYMPRVCHLLPLKYDWNDDETICTIEPWDASMWTGHDVETDEWMCWWCVDVPETYVADSPLYVRMRETMIEMMGEEAYNELCAIIARKRPQVDPMAAAVRNEGRPLLPLLIGGRRTKNPDPNFQASLDKMKESYQ